MSAVNDRQSPECLDVAAVAHALVAEGATNVWGDAMRGLRVEQGVCVGGLVLHDTIVRDGESQTARGNANYQRFTDAGVSLDVLDRHDDGSDRLQPYTDADLKRILAATRGKHVVTALEEYPLDSLAQLAGQLPPIVANLYRSGDFKSEQQIASLLAGLGDGTIALCTVDADASLAGYTRRGVPEESIRVIHNGIDTKRFVPSPAERRRIRAELAIPEESPVVLLVARDSEEKDIPLFLKSARLFLEFVPNAHVVMAGTGLSLANPNIKTSVERYFGDVEEVSKRLHALGGRSDIPGLYAAADVLAITSATESRPLCISEANAVGLGVTVSTEVGDAPSMIGRHGFVTSRNPAEIAERWINAYNQRLELAFPLSRRDELGTSRMIQKYGQVLRSVVSQRR